MSREDGCPGASHPDGTARGAAGGTSRDPVGGLAGGVASGISNGISSGIANGVSFLRAHLFEVALLAFGLGFCRVWVICSLQMASSGGFAVGGPFQLGQVFLLAGAVASCAAGVAVARLFASRRPTPHRRAARLDAVVLGFVAASLAAMRVAGLSGSAPTLVVAFSLAGASSGLLQVLWGERFVRCGVRVSLLAAPAGAAVTAVAMMAFPMGEGLASFYAAPLLSFALLFFRRGEDGAVVFDVRRRSDRCGPQADASDPLPPIADDADVEAAAGAVDEKPAPLSVSTSTLARLMASIAVFSLAGRCLDSFPVGDLASVPAFFAESYAFLAILLVGAVLFAAALALGERFDTVMVYRLSLPIMVAGFVILTLFVNSFTVMSIFVVTVGYEFFDVMFWAMLAVVVLRTGRSAVPVFGCGVSCTYLGMALGTLLGRVVAEAVAAGEMDVSSLSLVVIFMLVVLVVLVLPEGVFSKLGPASRSVAASGPSSAVRPGADDFARRCEAVATRFELTPRERDVFTLIARGRTLGVVSRELGIAEGTARTHMGHIYAKLGVHKQQELIDLVEGERLGGEDAPGDRDGPEGSVVPGYPSAPPSSCDPSSR